MTLFRLQRPEGRGKARTCGRVTTIQAEMVNGNFGTYTWDAFTALFLYTFFSGSVHLDMGHTSTCTLPSRRMQFYNFANTASAPLTVTSLGLFSFSA